MIELIVWVIVAAFIMEFVDSTIGGGFGTVLSPLLILSGFEPLLVVPAILLSEIFTGFTGGFFHQTFKNVDIRNDEKPRISLKILIITGLFGSVFAVLLSVSLPSIIVKTYIAVLVIAMAFLVILTRNGETSFRKDRLWGLGLLSAFNKGISGGGYGPIVVSGQLLSGLDSKASVAVTSIAEAATCVFGLITYAISGNFVIVSVTVSICLGAILATPLSALGVSKVKHKKLRHLVGIGTLMIGLYTIIRLIIG